MKDLIGGYMMRVRVTFVYGIQGGKDGITKTSDGISVGAALLYVDFDPDKFKFTRDGVKFGTYPFPSTPTDFTLMATNYSDSFFGEMPNVNAEDFDRKHKFGLTGFRKYGDYYFAGSWNGVYVIDKDLVMHGIITNRLMCDLHGIWVDKNGIITSLTGKDTVVFNDFSGNILNYFSVRQDLSINRNDKELIKEDWRFIGKQNRGPCGYWHINNIQRIEDELWLTARNINAFIVIKMDGNYPLNARIQPLMMAESVLIHDGDLYGDSFYFTSINGNVLIASKNMEKTLYNTALPTTLRGIKLIDHLDDDNENDGEPKTYQMFGDTRVRTPSWCRGVSFLPQKNILFTTVGGRYGDESRNEHPGFTIAALELKEDPTSEHEIALFEVGFNNPNDDSKLEYATGWGIIAEEIDECVELQDTLDPK